MIHRDGTPISQQLLEKSQFFAQSAIATYSAESWDVFYLHLATAVELLAKCVLASANPSFIADPRAGFDSLLQLSGLGSRAKPGRDSPVRTISASEAIDRVGRLIDNYREPAPTVRALLETRNAIVHGGRNRRDEADPVLGEVAQYVKQLLASVGTDAAEFWGPSAGLVGEHAARRLDAIEASYRRKLEVARWRSEQITKGLPEASVAALLAAASAQPAVPPYEQVPVPCPACGNRAELFGEAEAADWEADYDVEGGEAYVSGVYVSKMTFNGHALRCGACGLRLDAAELEFADLASITVDDDEYDAGEASDYFGRVEAEDWDD